MKAIPIRGKFKINVIYGAKGKYWKNGHKGIDFLGDEAVFATSNGKVSYVGYDADGWGYYISVQPDDAPEYREIFCHLKKGSIQVKKDDLVSKFTLLGRMGSTGNSTGVHLHYEVRKNNVSVNAAEYLGIPNKEGTYYSAQFEKRYDGWLELPQGDRMYFENGKSVRGLKKIDGVWYYFNKNGVASSLKLKKKGFIYIFDKTGRLVKKTKSEE